MDTFERQMDELSALKGIYGSDLHVLRQSALNCGDNETNWSPIEVQITLKPMASMSDNKEVYVQLDLYVKCGKKYPNVIPEDIALKNVKGLAVSVCQELRSQLYALAKSLRGEVMIFAFTDHIRQCLHSHNKPPIQSFYDQMIDNKTKLEIERNLQNERQLETMRRRDELKRKQLEEEMQRKQMAFLEESRLRRDSREDILDSGSDGHCSDWRCVQNRDSNCISFDVNGFERQIQRAKCLLHNHLKHSVEYLAIDSSNGQTFVINEWILRLNTLDANEDKSVDDIVARISKIETFFRSRMKCLNHSDLIRSISLRHSVQSDHIVIDLLQEHINGNSLFSLAQVMRGQPFNMDLIRHYAKRLLEIMNYLHRHNCPHGDLRPTNVIIDMKGDVRVGGHYLEKQFFDLYCDVNSIVSNANNLNINRLKTKDVFDFGLLIVAISNDWHFIDESEGTVDLKKFFNRCNIRDEFKHFIEKCIDDDESHRWTPDLLLQHSFILSSKCNVGYNVKTGEPNAHHLNSERLEPIENVKNKETNIQTKVLLNSIVSTSLSSRLMNEFEVLDDLGKGGFGFVYKVKNILDGRCYALKKIPINPSNHSLYEKIKREVNLLSRLNHENVVRYFTSWIESQDNVDRDDSQESSCDKTSDNLKQISVKTDNKSKSKTANDDKEKNDSYDSDTSSIEEVDFEAEEDIFGTSFIVEIPNNSSDSQYVVFERTDCCSEEKTQVISSTSVDKDLNKERPLPTVRQFMYIQMELCEKNTLRDAIDGGLYSNTQRKRRLFREIVEGLVHIHEQGMIHRDLKPGNVFLDLNDHVKIGDFGLAKEIYFIKDQKSVSDSHEIQFNSTQESDKLRLTGRIGTPFYVAPELTVGAEINSNKIFYTQKVDIYSLGVMFFEMSYPFETSMERMKVIMNLRKKEIVLPLDVSQHFTDVDIELLVSLLQHDYSLRPTSSELLASDYLPAPEMEEKEEQNVIRRAVQNSRTKIHKYLLNMLFTEKEMSEIEDYVFDMNDRRMGASVRTKSDLISFITKQRVFQYVYSVLESVMQSHCAVCLSLSTFVPKHSTQQFEGNDIYYLIDNSGSLVSVPFCLRVPFARYVARNSISYMRRYSIEKVYRQRKVMGYHPRELWECAFDIVAPIHSTSGHCMPDAEVIAVLSHVINRFPSLSASKLTLKVNHIQLIKAILNYCDIDEGMHNRVIEMIGECNSLKAAQNWTKDANETPFAASSSALNCFAQRKKILEKCLDESKINCVLQLLDLEQESAKKLMANIKTHMRKKGLRQQSALEMAKRALKQLDCILDFVQKLGHLHKMSVRISPSFVMSGSTSLLYSGIIFRLERELKHKTTHRQHTSVIAVGGRYDQLIAGFDVLDSKNNKNFEPKGAVGLSIEFEKLMKYVLDEEIKTKTIFGEVIDVVICSLTSHNSDSILRELCSVTKELWNSGIKVFCFPEDLPKNIDEMHSFCLENAVRYAVAVKESVDPNQPNITQISAKLFSYEKERFVDKRVGSVSDIIEYVIRNVKSLKNESNSASNSLASDQTIARSDSQSICANESTYTQPSTIASNIRVSFITSEKLPPFQKKKLENNIIYHLSNALNFVSNNTIIEVIGVDIPFKVVKTIAAEMDFDVDDNESDNSMERSKQSIIDKHIRYRKHITSIVDAVIEYKVDNKCPIVCIISNNTIDNMRFKILS